MATQPGLSAQDKKDLDKLTKFLALKSAQVIVQARLGAKVHTECNPDSTATDWFNLAIRDLPEVLAEAKKAMCNGGTRLPLCVEISLRTSDEETMTLETWCIGIRTDLTDPSVRVTYAMYNRMGILLKSLVALTRVTPAYKLSRNKSDYTMCYRIYMGEPQLSSLGIGYTQMRVGQLSTPIGTLQMSVAYRTKLTISPQHTTKNTSIMLKSDHFRPEASPEHCLSRNNSYDLSGSLNETVKIGAFADNQKPKRPDPEPLDIPFSNLLTLRTPQQSPPQPPPPTPPVTHSVPIPTDKNSDCENGNVTPRCGSVGSHTDDFILVDLKTPFAGSNANTDLGLFYRECQSAPPLHTFSSDGEPSVAEQVGDLTKQLEAFETSLQEYDNIISSFCQVDNNN